MRRALLLLFLAAACAAGLFAQAPAPFTLRIIHLNDVYEILPVEGGKSGGLARVATVFEQYRLRSDAPVITTLGGDYLSPSALGTARVDGQPLAGRQMVDVLNATHLDWATFGNHEFDVSEAAFRAHLTQATFKIVSTNVTDANGQPFPGVATSAIVPFVNGGRTIRIGLVGVTLSATKKPWVKYREAIPAAEEEIAKLRGKVDAIVALTHLSLAQDAEFVTAIPEIDVVLGGHEHENWALRRGPHFTPIIKADANVRSLAIVSLTFGAAGTRPAVSSSLRLIDDTVASSPAVDTVARRWTQIGFDAFRKDGFAPEAVVATTTEPLDGRESTVRNRSGRLTDLITEAQAAEVKGAQVAVFNGGSVRIDDVIPPGPITEYDIIRVLPFGGKIAGATIDGALLARVLDMGVNNQGIGGYLHVRGAAFENGTWAVQGTPLDPEGRYRVALTDFLLSGGETNLGFLTRTNPGVHDVQEFRDIRRAVIEKLAATYGQPK
jgi:5'-nucleotidase / UDP-sugar diphosphatase